eukprot:11660360-Alexandrium_andersonii.AAC.1
MFGLASSRHQQHHPMTSGMVDGSCCLHHTHAALRLAMVPSAPHAQQLWACRGFAIWPPYL